MTRLPVTLWSCSRTDDREYQLRVIRVLRYCSKLFSFDRVILFSFLDVPDGLGVFDFDLDTVQIPMLDIDQFNIFVNRVAPRFLMSSEYAMSVHEDGFILEPNLWRNEFLDYDYIGAPWYDWVVGNGGFNIESRQMMQAKLELPFYTKLATPYDGRWYLPSDCYVCREHRAELEGRGFVFAPVEIASLFSSEQRRKHANTFGFHGRVCQPGLYAEGWRKIEESEK